MSGNALVEELTMLNLCVGGKTVKFGLDGVQPTCLSCGNITGYATLAWHLAEERKKELLGKDDERVTKAVIWQWLEERLKAARTNSTGDLVALLEDHLSTRTYLAGNALTLADVMLFYALRTFVSALTYQEMSTRYSNLTRWFGHIQSMPEVRQKLKELAIAKNKIY